MGMVGCRGLVWSTVVERGSLLPGCHPGLSALGWGVEPGSRRMGCGWQGNNLVLGAQRGLQPLGPSTALFFHTELVEVSASHFYHGNSLWAWDVLGWFWCQQQLPALHKASCALLVGAWVLGDVQSIPGMCEGRKEGICCEPSQVSVSSRLL